MENFLIARRRILVTAAAGAAVLAAPSIRAHDERPQYGGVVRAVRDTAYELVVDEGGVRILVDDHGNPVPVQGVTGQLVVTENGRRTETPLTAAGLNVIVAHGARWLPGQSATAVLSMPSRGSVVVPFGVRKSEL